MTSASSSIANSNSLIITLGTFNIASGAGAKTINNLSGTSSGNITLNENITINQTSDGEFQGAISGAGKSLTKTGANKLTLSGTNTYSGGTIVSAGTLEGNTLGLQGSITNNSTVIFNQSASDGIYSGIMSGTGAVQKLGANTVTFSGANTYSGGTTVAAGTLAGTATSLQGDITNNAALFFNQSTPGTYASVISGSGSVEKSGSNTLTLSGANTYSGGTTVTAGTLAGTATSLQGNIINNAALLFNQSTPGTYASVISGSGSVEKTGSDTLTLSETNTYAGSTTLNGGSLQLTSASSSIANSNSLVITSGTFNITSGAGAKTINNLSGTSSGNITLNENITINQTSDGEFQGAISGAGKSLTKTGANKLTLSGTNTYSGGTIVSTGTLEGNTLGLQGSITNNSNVIFNQSAFDGIYSGIMSGTGAVQKLGTNTVTFSGANTYSDGTIVAAGTLAGTATSLQGNITNNAALLFNQSTPGTYASVISGSGSVEKTGSDTLSLSGANTYSGGTTVTAGTLAGTATSLQGNITNNAALLFNQSTPGTYASVISGSGSVAKTGSNTLSLSGTNTYTGSTTINGGSLQLTSVSSSIANSNSLIITLGTFNIASGAGAKTVNNLSGTSSGNITLNENITINQTSGRRVSRGNIWRWKVTYQNWSK